jgi:hypothetical protein
MIDRFIPDLKRFVLIAVYIVAFRMLSFRSTMHFHFIFLFDQTK